MIFDENKRRYAKGDAWPSFAKLGASGTYTLRYQLCHNNQKTLTDLQNMPLELYIRLPSAIPLTVHSTFNSPNAISNAFDLPVGRRCSVHLNATSVASKLSSDNVVENNDVLIGSISFSTTPIPSLSSSTNLQYPICYLHYTKPSSSSASSSTSLYSSFEEKIAGERLSSNIRLLEIFLSDLKGRDNFDRFRNYYKELDVDNFQLKDKLRVFETFFSSVESYLDKNSGEDANRLADICQFINHIQDSINKNELAGELILSKSFDDEEDTNYAENAKLVEKKKTIYVSSLSLNLRILLLNLKNNGEANGKDKISELLKEIRKWIGDDAFNQPKYLYLQAQYEYHSNLFGLGLKSVSNCLSAKSLTNDLRKPLYLLKLDLYTKLNWDFILEYQRNLLLTHFPPSYPLFNH